MRTVGATATATVRFLVELGAYASLGYRWRVGQRAVTVRRPGAGPVPALRGCHPSD